MVELCVAITDPDTGGAPREFTLLSTTRDGSASMYIYTCLGTTLYNARKSLVLMPILVMQDTSYNARKNC